MQSNVDWKTKRQLPPPPHLTIQDKLGKTYTMPVEDKEKDLGIIIGNELKFHLQTNTAANKANRGTVLDPLVLQVLQQEDTHLGVQNSSPWPIFKYGNIA